MPSAPAAAMGNRKLFIVRTAAPFRDLFERWWDGDEWIWVNHGRPGGVAVTGTPGAAMLDSKLFVTIEDGRLFERTWTGSAWVWSDHGRPGNVRIAHGPSAAMMDQKLFVVVEDGRLFERHWTGTSWAWNDHGRPGNVRISQAPGAAMMNRKLFVVVEDGRLWERVWTGTAWVWFDHGRPANVRIVHAPGAAMLNSKLFVTVEDGRLFERVWTGSQWAWMDHGRPPGTNVATAPGAAMMNQKLFVGSADGRLFERWWNGSSWVWVDHGQPPGTEVSTAPGAAMSNTKLFVGTRNDRLFERFWTGSQWVWVDHGTLVHDTSQTVLEVPSDRSPRRTIAVIGDGFAEPDLQRFRDYVSNEVVTGVFGRDLFNTLRSSFRIIRIDLVSIASGVSQRRYDEAGTPDEASDDTLSSENLRNTRLRYIFTGQWAHCWMEESADTPARIDKALRRFAPGATHVLVVMNESGFGGCARGTRLAVTTGVGWAVVYHELGHTVGGLGDEYSAGTRNFTGMVSPALNCSRTSDRTTIAWADLVAASTPMPTTAVPPGGDANTTVGAYLGCGTFATGLFRPVQSCRMRDNSPPFCPVCQRLIRIQLA